MPRNRLHQFERKETSQNAAQHLQLSVDSNTQRKCCSCLCCFRPVPMQRASVQQTFPVYRESHARSDPIDPISIYSRTKMISNISISKCQTRRRKCRKTYSAEHYIAETRFLQEFRSCQCFDGTSTFRVDLFVVRFIDQIVFTSNLAGRDTNEKKKNNIDNNSMEHCLHVWRLTFQLELGDSHWHEAIGKIYKIAIDKCRTSGMDSKLWKWLLLVISTISIAPHCSTELNCSRGIRKIKFKWEKFVQN